MMVAGSAERWFSPGFVERHPDIASPLLHALQDAADAGYQHACRALADFDVRSRLGEIDQIDLDQWKITADRISHLIRRVTIGTMAQHIDGDDSSASCCRRLPQSWASNSPLLHR